MNTVTRVSKRKVKMNERPRQEGEPAQLILDSGRARAELGWQPRYGDLETMVRHAWNRELRQKGETGFLVR